MINLVNTCKLELTNIFVLLGIEFISKHLDNIIDINCNLKIPKMKSF